VSADGVNFCVYSRNASGITLALFDQADDAAPAQSIRFDPETNRT
jgi:glycogen operon protein